MAVASHTFFQNKTHKTVALKHAKESSSIAEFGKRSAIFAIILIFLLFLLFTCASSQVSCFLTRLVLADVSYRFDICSVTMCNSTKVLALAEPQSTIDVLLMINVPFRHNNDIKLDDTQLFFPLFSSLFLYWADFCSVFASADLVTVTVLYSLCLTQLTIGSYIITIIVVSGSCGFA